MPNTCENFFISAPEGSYKNSCKNIKVDGNTVRAKCKNKLSWYQDTSATAWCRDMINDDGSLSCRKYM